MKKKKIKDTTRTVLTAIEERLQLITKEVTEVLMLVEDNLRTSASSSGLNARGDNLKLMEEKLIKLLYPDEEPEDKEAAVEKMYWEWWGKGTIFEGGSKKKENSDEETDS